MVNTGNLDEQITSYVSPLDLDAPKYWQMKSLVRKMKKKHMKYSMRDHLVKSADEEVGIWDWLGYKGFRVFLLYWIYWVNRV